MPIRGSVVNRSPTFEASLEGIRNDFPLVDLAVKDLEEFLKLDYILPEIRISADSTPNVYAINLDYPPEGAAGRSRFMVTYHATDANPSPVSPYRTFTMLTITER